MSVKIREEIKTCYLIELSNKRHIQIDPDELPKVIEGIKSGNPVVVRQGIFNPSFFVDIVVDEKRIMEVSDHNATIKWQIEQGQVKPDVLTPLSDVFMEIRERLLEAPKDND